MKKGEVVGVWTVVREEKELFLLFQIPHFFFLSLFCVYLVCSGFFFFSFSFFFCAVSVILTPLLLMLVHDLHSSQVPLILRYLCPHPCSRCVISHTLLKSFFFFFFVCFSLL